MANGRPDLTRITLAILFIGALISWFLSRRITAPLGRLARAAQDLGRGNYSARLPSTGNAPTTRDEIGQLAAHFTRMAARVAEAHDALQLQVEQERATAQELELTNEELQSRNHYIVAANDRLTMAMREAAGSLIAALRERGRDLGFGSGIAQGYATLGQIGFSERSGYTAIGTVCNVAARLCAEAKDGQILLSQRVNVALKGSVVTEQLGALALKGLTQPVIAFNVPLAAPQPVLRVIEGGPQNV